jgi:CRP-like cAMP-binding protein
VKNVWHLQNVDWLQELPEAERERLRQAATQRSCAVGEIIFTPVPHPHSVYLLETGLVRIYRLSESGLETTLGYVRPGEVFGELAAFGDYPRESFAQASLPSTVWKVPRELFQSLVSSRPNLGFQITKQIGERLKRIESRVENLVFRDVHTRVILTLLELADGFGAPQPDGGVAIQVHLTQAELATLVGSTRQSVNASLRELEQAGLLARNGRTLLLRDRGALRHAARAPERRAEPPSGRREEPGAAR